MRRDERRAGESRVGVGGPHCRCEHTGKQCRGLGTFGRGSARGPPWRGVPPIDALRGLAVLLMALGNFELGVVWVPAWLKHTPDVGYTIADLVAPTFIVVSAFAIGPALARRRTRIGVPRGARLARPPLPGAHRDRCGHQRRAVRPEAPARHDLSWGVLQSIGGASLLLGLVIMAPVWVRVVIGLLLLAIYQGILGGSWGSSVLHTVQGGLPGTMAWGGLMILASAVADGWRALAGWSRAALLAASGMFASGAALVLSDWFPISKNQVSATYILLSLGLGLLAFALADLWFGVRPASLMWLQRIGRHPLQLYFAQLLMLAPLTLSSDTFWYAGAPAVLTLPRPPSSAASIVAWPLCSTAGDGRSTCSPVGRRRRRARGRPGCDREGWGPGGS